MGAEDLNERDLELEEAERSAVCSAESGEMKTHGRDLAVHEDTSEIELNLETDVDVGAAGQARQRSSTELKRLRRLT